jgi:hypothetical protein
MAEVASMAPRVLPAAAAPPPAPHELPEDEPADEPALAEELGLEHSPAWYEAKLKSEVACLLPPRQALELAKHEMPDGGLGRKMLEHFTSGQATVVHVDLNRELDRNPRLRELLASRIEHEVAAHLASGHSLERLSGAVWVSQPDYGTSQAGLDQRFALGATFFEYQLVGTARDGGLSVQLTVSDHYLWSPQEERPTKCLHAAGAALVAKREATEFHQFGQGELTIADPRVERPAAEPFPQVLGAR